LAIAVILILGLLWIVVLVPPILRARGQQSRTDSVGDFHYKLSSLGRANGHRTRSPRASGTRPIFVPARTSAGSMSATQKRRRDVLLVLTGIVALTLLVAVVTRSVPFIALQLVADAALGGYVYLLLQYKQRAQQQRTTVRYLGGGYEPVHYGTTSYLSGVRDPSSPRLVPLRQTASH
jgi:hypothetical protein